MSNDASFPVPQPSADVSDEPLAIDDPSPSIGSARAIATELFTVVIWTLAADQWIFHAQGYFAIAAFLLVGWALLILVHCARDTGFFEQRKELLEIKNSVFAQRWSRRVVAIASLMLLTAAARLAWQGDGLLIGGAVVLLVATALALSDRLPTLGRVIVAVVFLPLLGMDRIGKYGSASWKTSATSEQSNWIAVALPLAAFVVFGSIFVMANPDLVSTISQWLSTWADRFAGFLESLSIWELPFCIAAFFVGAGLMRPLISLGHDPLLRLLGTADLGLPSDAATPTSHDTTATQTVSDSSPLYAAFRNTLMTLIVLFVAYLIFEFTTLWKRDFPPGFYYAGYAHEGAAWLTVALALATLTLSTIFTDQVHRDRRVDRLKKLAWIWSATNLLLAIAVYNRLSIYVGYNGMTRMRTIGFFGISLVVVGFTLVVIKIIKRRSFIWCIQVQMVALAVAVILYSLFPVDYVAHRYNAAAVKSGYLKPSVMIAVKPISDEGMFPLLGLLDVSDPIIREGVRAQMAERQLAIESYSRDEPWHWHRTQYSKTRLYRRLQQYQSNWSDYRTNADARRKAIKQFETYAMQWY